MLRFDLNDRFHSIYNFFEDCSNHIAFFIAYPYTHTQTRMHWNYGRLNYIVWGQSQWRKTTITINWLRTYSFAFVLRLPINCVYALSITIYRSVVYYQQLFSLNKIPFSSLIFSYLYCARFFFGVCEWVVFSWSLLKCLLKTKGYANQWHTNGIFSHNMLI